MMLSTNELLKDWYSRLRFAQFSHYESAKNFDRMNYWLGIPVVGLSTIVGTSIFANLEGVADVRVQILIGLVSMATAILASLQTFLKFSERAEKHRVFAAKYGALRRKLEVFLVADESIVRETLTSLCNEIDKIAEEAPHVPNRIWVKRKAVLKEDREHTVGLLSS